MTSFRELGLAEPLLDALDKQGLTTPTPIQAKSIPTLIDGRDLCGIAQTGTGKTAAFALPVLHRLLSDPQPRRPRSSRVLVVAPTRELASQIFETFRNLTRKLDIRSTVVFGGVSQHGQSKALSAGVDVLVATPGRLLDLVEQRLCDLSGVSILVLDEADQMLDLGFIVPLRRIVKLIPRQRQTMLFSATMPAAIASLAGSVLQDAVEVSVAPVAATPDLVDQSVIFASASTKPQLLASLLGDRGMSRVLVFTRTKHGADKVAKVLGRAEIGAAVIHGNKSQGQRERALAAFKSGNARVMVATDIAARGIHVNDITHVVNYDLPDVPETYVHRIGRTARAGAGGIAISFCAGDERQNLKQIERLTRQRMAVAAPPAGIELLPPMGAEPDRQAPRGKRGGAPRQGKPEAAAAGPRAGRNRRRGGRSGNGPAVERSGADRGVDGTGLPGFIRRPGNDRRKGAETQG